MHEEPVLDEQLLILYRPAEATPPKPLTIRRDFVGRSNKFGGEIYSRFEVRAMGQIGSDG